jgi:F-type H+-transporting ATPase subunit b
MILLIDLPVMMPDPGLLFWTVLIFLVFWFFLGKATFTPIAQALKSREDSIDSALKQAEVARQEMGNMKSENEKLLAQAREERAAILREANANKDAILSEARAKAKEDASKLIATAKVDIENQQKAAMTQVKNDVGNMALAIAEKIIRKQLANDPAQVQFANDLVKEVKL